MQKLNASKFHLSNGPKGRPVVATLFLMLITCALAVTASAQDPLKVAPQAYKLQLENDWIRVIRVHYAPHEKLPAHDHPKRQTIFIYLNDGGPVLFKHVEGYSGSYPATRPATKAGAYRLAGVQPENHIVENLSDIPSDFLQVELKTEAIEPKTFHGRVFPDPASKQNANYLKVELENAQVRVSRMVCAGRSKCDALKLTSYPALVVALSPLQFKMTAGDGKSSRLKLDLGQTMWLEPNRLGQLENLAKDRAEQLLIEFKSKPVK